MDRKREVGLGFNGRRIEREAGRCVNGERGGRIEKGNERER